MSKRVIGAVVAVAVAIVAVLVVVQLKGNDGPSASGFATSAKDVEALLKGIPQNGAVLGKPDAPVSIVEYVDFKCPVCAASARNVVPEVIKKHVRNGTAKIELRPILLGAQGGGSSILGPDSEIGALAGIAAAKQNRMWQFTEVMMANQGDEHTEWINEKVVTDAAKAVGMDVPAWTKEFKGDAVVDALFANNDAAATDKYTGTPFWVISGPGGKQPGFSPSAPADVERVDAAIAKAKAKA